MNSACIIQAVQNWTQRLCATLEASKQSVKLDSHNGERLREHFLVCHVVVVANAMAFNGRDSDEGKIKNRRVTKTEECVKE